MQSLCSCSAHFLRRVQLISQSTALGEASLSEILPYWSHLWNGAKKAVRGKKLHPFLSLSNEPVASVPQICTFFDRDRFWVVLVCFCFVFFVFFCHYYFFSVHLTSRPLHADVLKHLYVIGVVVAGFGGVSVQFWVRQWADLHGSGWIWSDEWAELRRKVFFTSPCPAFSLFFSSSLISSPFLDLIQVC